MIALGVVTYNRPDYFAQCMASIADHLRGTVARLFLHNDGSVDGSYMDAYLNLLRDDRTRGWFEAGHSLVNEGVGKAKNHLLRRMLAAGADWLFVAEDDIVVKSPEAVTGYIAAAEASGIEHLSFHAHGPGNPAPTGQDGPVTFWPNFVGAWCLYSRRSLETCGLFDEHFHNSFEHVEHTQRLAAAGFTTGYPRLADATGSENWLAEIPGSIANSSIRHTPQWQADMEAGKAYWRATRPDTYAAIWGAA